MFAHGQYGFVLVYTLDEAFCQLLSLHSSKCKNVIYHCVSNVHWILH